MNERGIRAGINRAFAACGAALLLVGLATGPARAADAAFAQFLEALWPDARALGISRPVFDRAFTGLVPDLTLPDLVLPGQTKVSGKGQAEFTRLPVEYLNPGQLAGLASQGRALGLRHAATLSAIEREIGVDRNIVLAIWGRETAFGTYKLPHSAIRVLATQAYLGRRKDQFRQELLYGLKMLEDRVVTPEALKSSWAGAVGLTQFLPSEYYQLAVDMDKDGRRDIWNSVPDALGSAAAQLKHKGWITGQPWGAEVRLPTSATCLWEGPARKKTARQWLADGVVPLGKAGLPARQLDAEAFLLMPAGPYGPAFMAFENYMVIKRYNFSDLYVLFVGNLADRIAGGGDFTNPWGRLAQATTRDIEAIQEKLKAEGYEIEKIDGKAGMNTRNQIGAWQAAHGVALDCWPSAALLAQMRAGATR